MSGRSGNGRGGRGGGRNGRGRGGGSQSRGHTPQAKQKGLCAALGEHIFSYSEKGSADQLTSSIKALAKHVGTIYSSDIRREIENRKPFVVPKPKHTDEAKKAHAEKMKRRKANHERLMAAWKVNLAALEAKAASDPESGVELAQLQNKMDDAEAEHAVEPDIVLTGDAKIDHDGQWKIYRDRVAQLQKHRGQVHSMVHGQCTQQLLDRLKQEEDWSRVKSSNDPLAFLTLIEKVVLSQTSSDKYPFAVVYEQETGLYAFRQNEMSNDQWYDRFNTRVEVANTIGVGRMHPVLLEWTAQVRHETAYEDLSEKQQEAIAADAEERYLAYVFLRQSGKASDKLRTNLSDAFTTGENKYPLTRTSALHYLDQHSKNAVVAPIESGGSSFAQQEQNNQSFDKEYWADKRCLKCGKMGHPARACKKKGHQSSGSSSSSRSSSRSSSSSSKKSKSKKAKVKQMAKAKKQLKAAKDEFKEAQESYAQACIAIEESEEDDSSIPSSESGGSEYSFFTQQVAPPKGSDLDLERVVLLDPQATVDLFCNKEFCCECVDSEEPTTVRGNGGELTATQTARAKEFGGPTVLFSEDALTNVLSLKTVSERHRVTYDSEDGQGLVVHREREGMVDLVFAPHESGLHVYDPAAPVSRCAGAVAPKIVSDVSARSCMPGESVSSAWNGCPSGDSELTGVDGVVNPGTRDMQYFENAVDVAPSEYPQSDPHYESKVADKEYDLAAAEPELLAYKAMPASQGARPVMDLPATKPPNVRDPPSAVEPVVRLPEGKITGVCSKNIVCKILKVAIMWIVLALMSSRASKMRWDEQTTRSAVEYGSYAYQPGAMEWPPAVVGVKVECVTASHKENRQCFWSQCGDASECVARAQSENAPEGGNNAQDVCECAIFFVTGEKSVLRGDSAHPNERPVQEREEENCVKLCAFPRPHYGCFAASSPTRSEADERSGPPELQSVTRAQECVGVSTALP